MGPFWGMVLGPRPRCALQRSVLGRGVRHRLLGAKELALPWTQKPGREEGTRAATSRFAPSEWDGQKQVERCTKQPQRSSPLHCLLLIYSGHLSPTARPLKDSPFCWPLHFEEGWGVVHNYSVLL